MTLADFTLHPLHGGHLADLLEFWEIAHPLHPLDEPLLRERLFEAPNADPDLVLAARDGAGLLLGLAAGVYPVKTADVGGIRWLGVRPGYIGQGVEQRLLDELGRRLQARGTKKMVLVATPPFYIRPGVDIREMELISALLHQGWKHEGTNFNMTVDLGRWASPGEAAIFGRDDRGYRVRRAVMADKESLAELVAGAWTEGWRNESALAFRHDPISVFVAEKEQQLVGFAAYEVSQCLGSFGPTGVLPEHRQGGVGTRLLWACLDSLQAAGRPVCEIGWVGPINFYYHGTGAVIGPVYWSLGKSLED